MFWILNLSFDFCTVSMLTTWITKTYVQIMSTLLGVLLTGMLQGKDSMMQQNDKCVCRTICSIDHTVHILAVISLVDY